MPVVLDIQLNWIGKTLGYMEQKELARVDVSEKAMDEWSVHLVEAFKATLFAESAKEAGAWFVGANIPGKPSNVLFYFGGVPTWAAWLNNESDANWASMEFSSSTVPEGVDEKTSTNLQGGIVTGVAAVA
ncbi:hypothetical protein LTR07_006565 [Exophiala xenobiotica]|nr:hypothetical protein LTR07_006565 [Exophiala xenobiotica]